MSSTTDLTGAIIVLLVLGAVFTLANLQINDYVPGRNFYTQGEATLDINLTTGTHPQFNSSDFPNAEESVSPEDGSVFTDLFRTTKNWLLESTGANIVINVLGAPYFFLSAMGISPAITIILTALWYGVFFFLFVAWLRGL